MFFKRSREKKKRIPKESAPVISRTGKISRKSPDEVPAENFQGQIPAEQLTKQNAVTISDGNFSIEKLGQKDKKEKIKFHTVKSKEKVPFPVMTVAFCVICTVLVMSVIVNFVQINEYSKDVAALQRKVDTINKEKSEVRAELDGKNNGETVRKYLKEHAGEMGGMVEEGVMNPPVAVTPDKEETVDDYSADEKENGIISVALNALAYNLLNAWNIFSGNE